MIIECSDWKTSALHVSHQWSITDFGSTFGQKLVRHPALLRSPSCYAMFVQRRGSRKVLPAGEKQLHLHRNVQSAQERPGQRPDVPAFKNFRAEQYVSVALPALRGERFHREFGISIFPEKAKHQPVMSMGLTWSCQSKTGLRIKDDRVVMTGQGPLNCGRCCLAGAHVNVQSASHFGLQLLRTKSVIVWNTLAPLRHSPEHRRFCQKELCLSRGKQSRSSDGSNPSNP